MAAHPDLAVVILSYNEDARTLLAAVDSILAQPERAEIVVSHSGPAKTLGVLRQKRPEVPIVASLERRLPGAARNAGVAATRAPFVSFLACDCRARPGWVAARLARHRRGTVAVASAVVPADPALASVASCLLTDGYRLPGVRAREHMRFGVSYARELLERYGPFPEELEFAEDSVMNRRLLSAGVSIELAEDAVTEHAYPTSLGGLLREQFQRGRASGRLDLPLRLRAGARLYLVIGVLREASIGVLRAHRSRAVPSATAALAVPLLALGAAARAVGILAGGPGEPAAAADLAYRRWAERGAVNRRQQKSRAARRSA